MVSPAHGLPSRYLVSRELGRGGMGIVYHATDSVLDRPVAIKVLKTSQLDSPTAVSRFMQEGRLCAKIRSEHCIKIFDLGITETSEPFLVMELLEGTDLAAHLRERKRISVAEAAAFIVDACDVLAEAHTLGVVHRDLKPHNLFLTHRPDGATFTKVLDFGLAKVPFATAMTATGVLLGTPAYMAPEQIDGQNPVDAPSDLWALGTIFYELVSGVRPFTGESIGRMASNILRAEPRPLAELVSDVPAEASAIISRCLRKDPRARFGSAEELARALKPLAKRIWEPKVTSVAMPAPVATRSSVAAPLPPTPPVSLIGSAPEVAPAPRSDTFAFRRARPKRRARPFMIGTSIGVGLVLVAVLVAAGTGAFRDTAAPSPHTTAPYAPAATAERALTATNPSGMTPGDRTTQPPTPSPKQPAAPTKKKDAKGVSADGLMSPFQ